VVSDDSFVTYTLYRPPGTDTKLVALKNFVRRSHCDALTRRRRLKAR
jgi:hypothetical protein